MLCTGHSRDVGSEVLEYCGLDADLLEDPIDRSEEGERMGFPRRRDWQAIAGHLSSAWYKLRNLTTCLLYTSPSPRD